MHKTTLRRGRARAVAAAVALVASSLTGLVAAASAGAAADDLFFSEYIEGTSNNKALEIFNGTGSAVDLAASGYNVQMYFNGSASAALTVNLTGTVADNDVYVLAQSSASAAILSHADQTNGSGWFNGDDAVVLRKGTTVLDVIGQIGVDPGSEWGTGLTSTADNTLRRKPTVSTGDADGSNAFDPATQWDGFATDTFDGLGSHVMTGPDAAPAVTAVSPSDGANDVLLDDVVTVKFSEPVDLGDAPFDLTCTISGPHDGSVSGGPTTWTIDPSADFVYGDVCTLTVDADAVHDIDTDDPPDTMSADATSSFTVLSQDPCGMATTPVPAIQGSGESTPYAGQQVWTRGVVSAVLPGLSGFALQDTAGDGDPSTSDGVFVYVPNGNRFATAARELQPGRVVTLKATPKEFQEQTELDTVTVLVSCGATTAPDPTVVTLPEKVNGELERFEGMLVTFPQRLTVQQNYFLGRYGQLTVGVQGRAYQPTNLYPAGSDKARAEADRNARSLFVLDDAFSGQNPDPIPFMDVHGVRRAGDTIVGGMTGVLDYGAINSNTSIRDYRLQRTVEPRFVNTNERTATPDPVGGTMKVASFNVLNYFTTFAKDNNDARGAWDAAEFARQRAKIFSAMAAIDADVFGLMEIENLPGTHAVQDLVDGLNAYLGDDVYAAVPDPAEGTGDDAIKVAMIYKPATVQIVGPAVSDVDPINDRPTLAATVMQRSSGQRMTVFVNHFKSKGSCPSSGPDADQGDGQGCWTPKRVEQAQQLVQFMAEVTAQAGDPDALAIGDLNSYAEEDPILALEQSGLINEVERWVGNKAYSYVFDGLAGYLDHALASPSLHPQVTGVAEWHINADEPSVIDYNLEFKPQDLYAPTPYRSSDHDPVVVGLRLR